MAFVLVAEDNLDHQRVMAEVVRRLGHEVTVADDGRAGLAQAAARRPDLVIADVDMPQLDGVQLCRALRADPGLAGVPVLLVTAFVPPGDPGLAEAGAAGVLHKPFRIEELTAALTRHLDGGGNGAGGAALEPRALLGALLETLDMGVAACDASGRLVVVNPALRRWYGDDSGAVPLREWPERFRLSHHDGSPMSPDDLPLVRALAGEHVERAELRAPDRQGRPSYFVINAHPVRDAGGGVTGAVAAVHDVTTDVRTRGYDACKAEVLQILARHPDTATAADRTVRAVGTTLGWGYVRLWLVDRVTDALRLVATYTAPGERPPPIPVIRRGDGLAGRCWERGELLWVPDIHAEGAPIMPEVAAIAAFRAAGAVPVRNGDQTIGVLTFFSHSPQEPEPVLAMLLSGIAGNIGAYLEQRRSEELAVHLAAATDEYIALVGHELRTPLTSIGTYTQLIAESPDDTPIGEVRDLLEVVERNNAALRHLVEQLLALAALEAGHVTLALTDVDLAATVAAAVASAAGGGRGIEIRADLPARLVVPGDRPRLRQVVDNLLDNAVKFSPDGATVTVTLATDGDAAVLTVADGGTGIPDADRANVFRRLYRGGNARHTGIPGHGLGLAFCRSVVERHHGSLTLAAGDPVGTTVTVRLPGSRRDG